MIAGLRIRLAEAEETLLAIRGGDVDSVMLAGKHGGQVFTLQGAEQVYRLLIESMNEGALTLAADKMILYANQCFARMVKWPLEQVMGGSFRRFLSTEDRSRLRALLKKAVKSGSKIQVSLLAADGSQMPVQISLRPLAKKGANGATIGMVVTDLTQVRRSEEMLRALANRVVQAQETERGRVALELHDHITQLLCAVLARSQALANGLSGRDDSLKMEAEKLRDMLGTTVVEVERISRNLRPGLLEHMGLAVVLRETSREFTKRTGVLLKLTCGRLTVRMPAEVELALYRILQEALKNLERHARARHVIVRLTQPRGFVQLEIIDDGVGFDAEGQTNRRKGNNLLGLLGMLERATYVGGTLTIKSSRGEGTQIEVRIPLTTGGKAGK